MKSFLVILISFFCQHIFAADIIAEGEYTTYVLTSPSTDNCSERIVVSRQDPIVYLEHEYATGRTWIQELQIQPYLDLGDNVSMRAWLSITEKKLTYSSQLMEEDRRFSAIRILEIKQVEITKMTGNKSRLHTKTLDGAGNIEESCIYELTPLNRN